MKTDSLHHSVTEVLNIDSFFSSDNSFNFNVPDGDFPDHAPLKASHHHTKPLPSPPSGGVGSTSTIPGVDHHWDGITFAQSGGYYPPDNALAVGTNIAITAENDAIQFTTLAGSGALTESLETFFGSAMLSGYFLTDPRVLYDVSNHRFVVAVDEVSNNLNSSNILLAVSKTDLGAPSLSASNWQFESQSTTYKVNGVTTWADQPLVSVDGHDIYVSTNQYSGSGNYAGSMVSVFDNGLYSPGSVSHLVSATGYSDASYQPAAMTGGGEYLVSYTYNGLSIFESKPTSAGGITLSQPLSVGLGQIDNGNENYSASQYGTSAGLDAGDGRVTSAAYDSVNQKLYAVFEVHPTNSTAPSVEWVQLDMTNFNASSGTQAPIVLHTGNLNSLLPTTGATAGAATFNGSVAVDANGDLLFNFNVSGSKMYPADYFTFWKGAGSATSTTTPNLTAPIDYHDSVSSYVDPSHDSVGRWGDYSTSIADPNVHNAFYVSNEFDNGQTNQYSSWGTAVAHILV